MDNNFKLTDEILWDYADGFPDGEEKLCVDTHLHQNPAQQARLDAILSEKQSFSALPLEKPDAGFAQQVMTAWAAGQPPAKAGRDWILWGFAAAFGLMIALPSLPFPAAAPAAASWQIPEQYMPQVQVTGFDWAGFLNGAFLRNFLILTLAFMGLKLLDKYLQVRNLHLSGHRI